MGLLKDIITLGGAHRLEKARERFRTSSCEYERLLGLLDSANHEIGTIVEKLKTAFIRTKRDLLRADKLLSRKCLNVSSRSPHSRDTPRKTGDQATCSPNALALQNSTSTQLTLGGIAVGTSVALAAWQGAQIIGIASTGTAMLGLHGAAASNAGWALFGGGSLATGGGGMALGHLVLPGLGIAVAVGFSAYTTHSKANEMNDLSAQMEAASEKNQLTLARAIIYLTERAKKLTVSAWTAPRHYSKLSPTSQILRTAVNS